MVFLDLGTDADTDRHEMLGFVQEEIDIEAKVLRAGKAVGVAVVELKKKSGKIIAQARYSKYLGVASRVGGYSYLYEPLWWVGMITMIVGEVANFAAYAFAPAILVTPLGALIIIISAVLAHVMLREKLHIFRILGCVLCAVGSTTIVLHAPPEREIESVTEVWDLATEPAFMCYAAVVIAIAAILVYRFVPLYGQTHVMVYIGVCSLVGSISALDTFNTVVCVTHLSYHVHIFNYLGKCHHVQGLSTSSSSHLPTSSLVRFSQQTDEDGEGIPLRSSESFRNYQHVSTVPSTYISGLCSCIVLKLEPYVGSPDGRKRPNFVEGHHLKTRNLWLLRKALQEFRKDLASGQDLERGTSGFERGGSETERGTSGDQSMKSIYSGI
ncbi:unnamed protein product [Miscanthus lutarioriparius]|uniref:Probable magnesium transporter n=1 Tax=Miscanthus lutarioriparius TaxID=422564 RepID=A0A811RZ13_9POAL|nr:unnamed protein product [Miscanthus lutarioriparius]